MDDLTPTQKASEQMVEAAFSDPELRERFKLMAKDTASREPVPDDFAWLSRSDDEYSRFETLTRRLIAVPKAGIDALRKKRA